MHDLESIGSHHSSYTPSTSLRPSELFPSDRKLTPILQYYTAELETLAQCEKSTRYLKAVTNDL